jgi:hypothetical protein
LDDCVTTTLACCALACVEVVEVVLESLVEPLAAVLVVLDAERALGNHHTGANASTAVSTASPTPRLIGRSW